MLYKFGYMSTSTASPVPGETRTVPVRFPILPSDAQDARDDAENAPSSCEDKCAETVFPELGYAVVYKAYGADAEHDVPALLDSHLTALGVKHDAPCPIHRLDKTTAGLMLCAFTKYAAAALSAEMADGAIRKRYAALVSPAADLPECGEMRDFLYFDKRSRKAYSVSEGKRGAKEALLDYELGGSVRIKNADARVARIALRTGRTHQIRAQFAARRSPIIGDGKYGSRVNYSRPTLFSVSLELAARGVRFDIGFAEASGLPVGTE